MSYAELLGRIEAAVADGSGWDEKLVTLAALGAEVDEEDGLSVRERDDLTRRLGQYGGAVQQAKEASHAG